MGGAMSAKSGETGKRGFFGCCVQLLCFAHIVSGKPGKILWYASQHVKAVDVNSSG
jgi:hypothetical protein